MEFLTLGGYEKMDYVAYSPHERPVFAPKASRV
jgi:hypothetical protein